MKKKEKYDKNDNWKKLRQKKEVKLDGVWWKIINIFYHRKNSRIMKVYRNVKNIKTELMQDFFPKFKQKVKRKR